MTLVSFIVPVFNKEKHLAAVLRAIDGQTGGFEREIIAVDDGSSDGSSDILASFARGRADVAVLRLEDEGPAVAVNRAAARARGEFLKFVDGDDILAPDCTEVLLAAMQSTGAVLACGDCGDYRLEDLAGFSPPRAGSGAVEIIADPRALLVRNIPFTMSGSMASSAAFRGVHGCDERVFVHDSPLFLRLAAVGRFARVASAVAFMPRTDAARWSNRALGQVLHDVNMAVYFMLRETPNVSLRIRNKAARRTAGRAWNWARRHGGASVLSRYFLLHLVCHLPLPCGHAALVRRTLDAFRDSADIRVPEPRPRHRGPADTS